MATNLYDWSATASDNATADSAINWAENQLPGTVNGSARSMMAATARFLKDINGTVSTGGSSNAYTVTPNTGHTALTNGTIIGVKASFTNTGNCTLNFNLLGAKKVFTFDGEVAPGQITSAGRYLLQYDSSLDSSAGAWVLLNPSEGAGVAKEFYGSTAPAGYAFVYGQAVSRTTYPALFAVCGTTYGAGDGSSTFNLPDRRGRVAAGKDDMGGPSANRLTDQSGGLDGDALGDTGGAETHTLSTAQTPAHMHTISITSGTESATHTHSGTTGTESTTHNHTGETGGANSSLDHTHNYSAFADNSSTPAVGGAGAANAQKDGQNDTTATGAANSSLDHTHSFSTSAESATHTHTITTETASASHTHAVSGTSASTGGDGAHNNVQPTIICNVIMRLV